jgi:hypothetical protein
MCGCQKKDVLFCMQVHQALLKRGPYLAAAVALAWPGWNGALGLSGVIEVFVGPAPRCLSVCLRSVRLATWRADAWSPGIEGGRPKPDRQHRTCLSNPKP